MIDVRKEQLFLKVWQSKKEKITQLCRERLGNESWEVDDVLSVTAHQLWDEISRSEGEKSWGRRSLEIADCAVKRKLTELKRKNRYEISLYSAFSDGGAFMEYAYDGISTETDTEEIKEKILGKLSKKERELFEMIYDRKMKYNDIAEKLGISEGAVKQKNFRLRRKITEIISLELEGR